ncbi:hypothetical protein NL676_025743 [Syzygium grande]|nr:hypothetical protein NL676_025743 [Syzygium grande]
MVNELDKISQLPRNIIDQILSHMPIKDAVRTSILSRKWRYKWSSLPQLVFDDQCTNDTSPHEKLVKIIDKNLHQRNCIGRLEFAELQDSHLLIQLPRLDSFGILENDSLKYLAVRNVSQTWPYALDHLKYLFTCIDFNHKEEILTVMCLIKSSPQLKQVDFQNRAKDQQTARIETVADFQEDHSACCQERVQVVSMSGIFGNELELKLMKFLLASLPNLQKMTIQPIFKHGEGKLLRELLRFRRASAQAEVIFL